jgi:hypothetical protein
MSSVPLATGAGARKGIARSSLIVIGGFVLSKAIGVVR